MHLKLCSVNAFMAPNVSNNTSDAASASSAEFVNTKRKK